MLKFGTGGWRAVIGDDFVRENIMRVAQGVVALRREEGGTTPIVIGYDRRFLSDSAAKWIAGVLAANDIQVLFLNRSAPTPLIMHTVKKLNLDYGMEVTASHNPSEYNGIKLIVKEGRDASAEVTNRLEQLIESLTEVKSMEFSEAIAAGKITYIKNPFNAFLDDILGVLDTDAIRERGLRILFDPMHGSSVYPLEVIFFTTRCTLDLIHNDKDAYFGGSMPAPTEKTLTDLSQLVVSGGYDLGIGVDGDGDRLGIIDKSGRYISANEILVMLYYYLHEYKGWKGPVVRNLATTHMLDKVAESFGEVCYEVPVGFKWISSKIDEVNAVLGGESSGGLTVRGHIHGKDSVYAAALFAEMISVIGKSPSELMDELTERYGSFEMSEFNLRFDAADKPRIEKIIFEEKRLPEFGHEIERVTYDDGCKVYFKDVDGVYGGFIICRFSGTEPLLRIFAEGTTAEIADRYIASFKEFLGL
ncbi:MAG: phosphoglucomutase/phosphomannomutase family protein [Ruminococcaceae bacterium]|nr:phosphoglucomutase/phosphomannomutase family protein [Oscillospiraceae bacterium]